MHKSLIGLCFVALLAGCSGNTYGTGVSSEKQLADDIGSMLTLNMGKKRKNIKYPSRPSLVKPPEVAQLPAPAESTQAESAYFPEDPETKRKRLLAELEEARQTGAELSPELQRMRAESLRRSKTDPKSEKYAHWQKEDGDCVLCEYYERTEGDKKRLAEKTAERLKKDHKKRRYLTEPPDEYQAPAETATVGVVGDKELSEAQLAKQKRDKNKKTILERIFGG